MAAAAYGCSPATAARAARGLFAAFPSPPSRVSLSSRNPRAPAPSLRVSSSRRRAARVATCSKGLGADDAATPVDASVDLKLPRRSLLVQFTCGACGGRTKRLINRVAYERGTVFLQCAGCQVYHKFVDNLGLVVEYDLREENREDPDAED